MIVEPDFPQHWKTQMLESMCLGYLNDNPNDLKTVLSGSYGGMLVVRLWGHCQQRRRWRFEKMTSLVLASVCGWKGDAEWLFQAFLDCKWITLEDEQVVVHEWDVMNTRLVTNWENGKKSGGRPKGDRNPSETQSKPKGGAIDKIDKIDKSVPPNPLGGDRARRFVPPELAEVVAHAMESAVPKLEAEKFFDHFTANGWRVGGKAPMKDWRAAFRNWCRSVFQFQKQNRGLTAAQTGPDLSVDAILARRKRQDEDLERQRDLDALEGPSRAKSDFSSENDGADREAA
jgi:hypothetical protein